MSQHKLPLIDGWEQIVGAEAIVWGIKNNMISQSEVDAAFASNDIWAEVTERTDDFISLRCQIGDAVFTWTVSMNTADAMVRFRGLEVSS